MVDMFPGVLVVASPAGRKRDRNAVPGRHQIGDSNFIVWIELFTLDRIRGLEYGVCKKG